MISSKSLGATYRSADTTPFARPTGLANAALRQERNEARRAEKRNETRVTLTLQESEHQLPVYARDGRVANASLPTHDRSWEPFVASDEPTAAADREDDSAGVSFGPGATLQVNVRGANGGTGTLVLAEGARVHVNTRGDGYGSGSLTVGEHSTLHINARGDSYGDSALVLGDNERAHINARIRGRAADADPEPALLAQPMATPATDQLEKSRSLANPLARREEMALIAARVTSKRLHTVEHAERGQRARPALFLDPRLHLMKSVADAMLRAGAPERPENAPAEPAELRHALREEPTEKPNGAHESSRSRSDEPAEKRAAKQGRVGRALPDP